MTVLIPKFSFVIKATKLPAPANSARAIVSDTIGVFVTRSNYFDFHDCDWNSPIITTQKHYPDTLRRSTR